MTYKKKTLAGSLAVAVAAGAISVGVASAHFGSNSDDREAVHNAIRNNDFKAFSKAIEGRSIIHNVDTEKEFTEIALAYDLRHDGKYKEAREVLERAGIERPGHERIRHRDNLGIRSSVDNNDWNEFQEVANGRISNKIDSEDKFNLFVEAHELRKDGRYGEAHKIMNKLGLGHMK